VYSTPLFSVFCAPLFKGGKDIFYCNNINILDLWWSSFLCVMMDRQGSGSFSGGEIALARNLLLYFETFEISSKIGDVSFRIRKLKSINNILWFPRGDAGKSGRFSPGDGEEWVCIKNS